MGHAVRDSGLLELLQTPFELTVYGRGDWLEKMFQTARIIRLEIETPRQFEYTLTKYSPDLVMVDYPMAHVHLWHALRVRPNLPVVAIDDEGGDVYADLIINGTVLKKYHRYPALPPGAKVLSGGPYALIRPEFGRTPWSPPPESNVVIVVGSGERAHKWAVLLTSGVVDTSDWGQVCLIVGETFPEIEKLSDSCDAAGIQLRRGCSAQEMAETLSGASTALTTGGMIVYEAIAVGVPLVAFPQIPNLIPEMRWFAAQGCLADLGYDGGMNIDLIESSLQRVLNDDSFAQTMSLAQRATLDGRGMIRAARAIDTVLQGGCEF